MYSQFVDDNIWRPKQVSGKRNRVSATLDRVPADMLVHPPLKPTELVSVHVIKNNNRTNISTSLSEK